MSEFARASLSIASRTCASRVAALDQRHARSSRLSRHARRYVAAKRRLFELAPRGVLNVDDGRRALGRRAARAGVDAVHVRSRAGAGLVADRCGGEPRPAVSLAAEISRSASGTLQRLERIGGDRYRPPESTMRRRRGLAALERVARPYGTRSRRAQSTPSSTTRIRPMHSRTRCARCAKRRAALSSSSAAAATAIAASGRRWARSPPVRRPRHRDQRQSAQRKSAAIASIVRRYRSRRVRRRARPAAAIERAVEEAGAGDVVGRRKGTRAYQLVGDRMLALRRR